MTDHSVEQNTVATKTATKEEQSRKSETLFTNVVHFHLTIIVDLNLRHT